jgi:hypothetical protein
VGGQDDGNKTIQLDLAQDTYIDPTPFSFRPFHLASLVDPKSLEVLEAMGGLLIYQMTLLLTPQALFRLPFFRCFLGNAS